MHIEPTLQSLTLEQGNKRKPEAPEALQFSYAMASASLERRAGASLQAHGGKPQEAQQSPVADSVKSPANNKEPSASRTVREQSGEGVRFNGPAEVSTTRNSHAAQGTANSSAAAAPVATAFAPSSGAPFQAGVATAITATRAQTGSVASTIAETASRTETLKLSAKPQTQAAAKPQESFAHLLAKRLDAKTSVFDIRLDPPELGRIAGRFEIADDGAGVLKLSFDTQSTFDMFRRDETLLRQALADAGVSLNGQSLEFEYTPAAFDWRTTQTTNITAAPASDLARVYAAHIPSSLIDLFT